ncbi:MAG TPA: class I SAM-dependent methyltransferase [Baekduia sp.]|uniref:class I SAM-dependent methyltransferase n=1 Tax=Baekduia sp. TaxID=2600305 RepID=UPI002BEE3597|nr:class I SAM-dependent methyltransferase [Baekduia sp.]HMJ33090.1 class I SAM-dependent methyltransferase [Baekduia sp.]
MLELAAQLTCRLSGEPLNDARVVLDLADCPLPGVYPPTAEASVLLRSPLRVVQAAGSGLVQLAHRFDPAIYGEYGFAADTSVAYRRHLRWFADQVAGAWPATAAVLEVGCGDGLLLDLLGVHGFADRTGVDPGRAAGRRAPGEIVGGYFPDALDAAAPDRRYDLIVLRHVLEHIETPVAFAAALAQRLAPGGEVWIEVPDLDATLERELWSNLYQLHCNYFDAATLDALAGTAGLVRLSGELVDVFGGSLLHRYGRGTSGPIAQPPDRDGLAASIGAFRDRLARLAACLPEDTVGYGAAERTAMTLGAAPELAARLRALFDGNALLGGRFLAGTALPIAPPEALYASAPRAVVLFAVSHREEILREWRTRLPVETLVAVAGQDTECTPLGRLVAP